MINLASTLHSIFKHNSKYRNDLPTYPLDNPAIGLRLLLDTSSFHLFYLHETATGGTDLRPAALFTLIFLETINSQSAVKTFTTTFEAPLRTSRAQVLECRSPLPFVFASKPGNE